MFDILTIGAAYSLQQELEEVRKNRGEQMFTHENDESPDSGAEDTVTAMVETTNSAIEAVESAVTTAVETVASAGSALCPTSMPTFEPVVLDLTLPTAEKKQKDLMEFI